MSEQTTVTVKLDEDTYVDIEITIRKEEKLVRGEERNFGFNN